MSVYSISSGLQSSVLPQSRAINPFQKVGLYVSSFQKLCKVYLSAHKIQLRFLLTVYDYLKGTPHDYLTGTFLVSFLTWGHEMAQAEQKTPAPTSLCWRVISLGSQLLCCRKWEKHVCDLCSGRLEPSCATYAEEGSCHWACHQKIAAAMR